jgi:phage gpG-like protein
MASPDALIAELRGIQLRSMQAAPPAVKRAAEAFHDRLVNVTLRTYQHPMYVMTQAPAGGPPAWMTGELAYSVTNEYAGSGAIGRAFVGPHTIYAAVQEEGRVIRRKSREYMRWYMTGVPKPGGPWWYKKEVTVPARPYMRPTRDAMIADGSLREAFMEGFREWMGM